MRKRSSCASGSGNVPEYSTGFWVAMTMKGFGRRWVSPSIVTWCSSIASSNAAWVLGLVRLIPSASRTCANTGQGRNSNSVVFWLKSRTPVTSDGRRSGVNWMLRNVQSSERASDLASIVLPTPGTSSIRRCPSQRRVTRHSLISSSLLTIARLTFDRNAPATCVTTSAAPPPAIIGSPFCCRISVEYVWGVRLVPRSVTKSLPYRLLNYMRFPVVVVPLAVLACGSAGQAPAVGTPLTPAQLKFAVMDAVGHPVYCDPDFYPLARVGGEEASAVSMYTQIKADAEVYAAIVAHEHLPSGDLNDAQKLVAYRSWKLLRAVALTQSGSDYSFQYRVQSKGGS